MNMRKIRASTQLESQARASIVLPTRRCALQINGVELEDSMRRSIAAALALGAALPGIAPAAEAANVPAPMARPAQVIGTVQQKQYRPQRDCTSYNGPFGFYGNVWCQPPNEQSYLRNLGSPWPMATPPSLRYPKRTSNNA